MKFILLVYLIYYLIEDSNSFKDDDDSSYPRVYYLKPQSAQSAFKQKSKGDTYSKPKRDNNWSLLDDLRNVNEHVSKPLHDTDPLSKLLSSKSEIKKTIKVSRNLKKLTDKAKSNKRISSLKLNNNAKQSKRINSKKRKLRSPNRWNKSILKSKFDGISSEERVSLETQEGFDYQYEYPSDMGQKLGSKKVNAKNTARDDVGEKENYDYTDNDQKDTAEDVPKIKYTKDNEYLDIDGKSNEGVDERKWPENYKFEIEAGELADMVQNKRHFVPMKYAYNDLGRRFVLQYPYTEVHNEDADIEENTAEFQLDEAIKEAMQQGDDNERLKPVKANPGLVLSIARESALLEASKPVDLTREIVQNNLLRTGEYWNSYWREDVSNPEEVVLRSEKNKLHPKLETVRVKIMPASRLYQLVSIAKKISPRLLYIINTNKDAP